MKLEERIRYKIGFEIGCKISEAAIREMDKNEFETIVKAINSELTLKTKKEILNSYGVQINEKEIEIEFICGMMYKYRNAMNLLCSIYDNMPPEDHKIHMFIIVLNDLLKYPDIQDVRAFCLECIGNTDKLMRRTVRYTSKACAKLEELLIATAKEQKEECVQLSFEFDDVVDELYVMLKMLLERNSQCSSLSNPC